MSNKTILMEAARKKCREQQPDQRSRISYDYMPIFPNCTFWEHQDPIRFVDRIPVDTFHTVKVCLGCPHSKMPSYMESLDPSDFMEKYDFQALNNCNGAGCEWYNTGEEKRENERIANED